MKGWGTTVRQSKDEIWPYIYSEGVRAIAKSGGVDQQVHAMHDRMGIENLVAMIDSHLPGVQRPLPPLPQGE